MFKRAIFAAAATLALVGLSYSGFSPIKGAFADVPRAQAQNIHPNCPDGTNLTCYYILDQDGNLLYIFCDCE